MWVRTDPRIETEYVGARSTHITLTNGLGKELLLHSDQTYPDLIRFTLNEMDGFSFWAWGLWSIPSGTDLREPLPDSESYMQCAGNSEGLTVEVRTVDADGIAHQYAVGKPAGDYSDQPSQPSKPSETIRWDDGRSGTAVYPNEVFTADEAAAVFYTYFLTGGVRRSVALRELELG